MSANSPTGPLNGRVALLTGASGGIGGALATALAQAGADVVLTHGAHAEEAQLAAEQVRGLGRRALVVAGDLADPDVPVRLVEAAEAGPGPVDVLLANAGAGRREPWEAVDAALWDSTMAVNLRAPFLLAQRVLPGMVERRWGRVLFVSSLAGLTGGLVGPHYAASKAGLHGLTHHLAARVAAHGVTVNSLAPALVAGTRMLPTDPDAPGALPAPVPVGRLGRPEEVAAMAMAMVTNAYLTSKVVTLDGGMHPV